MYVKNADMIGRSVRLRDLPTAGPFTVRKIVGVRCAQLLCGFIIDGDVDGTRKTYEVVRKQIRIAG